MLNMVSKSRRPHARRSWRLRLELIEQSIPSSLTTGTMQKTRGWATRRLRWVFAIRGASLAHSMSQHMPPTTTKWGKCSHGRAVIHTWLLDRVRHRLCLIQAVEAGLPLAWEQFTNRTV